ncbi:hypothetical protein [Bradyrhizobium sp. BEA-2-5]|uniref:ATP dependent DNA ligase n=1 Tax=Bradyrhizobium TaxID=374 RepID=UPI00397E72F8
MAMAYFGTLVLAVREEAAWRYIGHVGTGFSHQTLEEFHGKLAELKAAKQPYCTNRCPSLRSDKKTTDMTREGPRARLNVLLYAAGN